MKTKDAEASAADEDDVIDWEKCGVVSKYAVCNQCGAGGDDGLVLELKVQLDSIPDGDKLTFVKCTSCNSQWQDN